jgi:hypothetical protein
MFSSIDTVHSAFERLKSGLCISLCYMSLGSRIRTGAAWLQVNVRNVRYIYCVSFRWKDNRWRPKIYLWCCEMFTEICEIVMLNADLLPWDHLGLWSWRVWHLNIFFIFFLRFLPNCVLSTSAEDDPYSLCAVHWYGTQPCLWHCL